MRCYVVLMVAFACSLASAASLADSYKHLVTMDEEGKYRMYWTMDETAKTINVAVSVQTTGWIGFGISPYTGRMPGSDIVMAWVDSQGKANLQDRYATAHALPELDSQQDYTLISGEETNGRTIIKFKRKFDTGDDRDLLVEGGTSRLIWAYHSQDPINSQTFLMHERQGSRSINLFTAFASSEFLPLPSDAKPIDVVNKNVSLPNRDTIYWCSVFRMPKVESSAHIVMIEPIIEKGHEGLVHHMLAYDCELEQDYHAVSHDCDSENMPIALQGCRGASIVGGWAIGAGNQSYPAHVGLPLGGASDTKYVLLEVHYDNPRKLSDLRDSSGMRFWYTYQKRQYDAATLEIGRSTSPFMVIPERQNEWEMAGYCSEDCTRRNLPATGVKFIAAGLHTHLAGVSLTIKHYRNGQELPDIIHNPHYDFNYQETESLKQEITFLPGDQLTLVCRYKTKDRSKVTVGGVATTDEMCLAYLTYYPKQPMTICMSHEDYDPYLGYFRDLREAKRTPPYNNYPSNPPYAWDVIHNATIGDGKFLRELNDLENEEIPQQYCAARNNVLLQPKNPMAIDKFTRYRVNKFLDTTVAASKPVTPSNGATTVHFSSILISIAVLLRTLL